MSNPGTAPDNGKKKTLQEQQKVWDAITGKRQEMLDAERARMEQKLTDEEETRLRQETEFLSEVKDARARADGREEWRKEQHRKKLEIEAQKRKEVAAQKLRDEVQIKQNLKLEEEKKALAELHKKAVEKRVATRLEGARMEEEKQKKAAENHDVHMTMELDLEAGRKIQMIERAQSRRKDELKKDAATKLSQAEEMYRTAKKDAAVISREKLHRARDEAGKRAIRLEESQAVSKASAERKRIIFGLDEFLQQKLFDIDTETKRLKDEVTREAEVRKARAHHEAGKRVIEAEARRIGTEKWFEKAKVESDKVKDKL
jgi:hypothetical protein